MKYKVSEYAKIHNVTQRTVWNWINKGELTIEYTPTKRVRIVIDNPNIEKTVAIYARVSSSENKDNLESQAERLISYCNAKGYKVSKIVKEIGSGLNDNINSATSKLNNLTSGQSALDNVKSGLSSALNNTQTGLGNAADTIKNTGNAVKEGITDVKKLF